MFQAWIPEYALTFNFPVWTLSVEMFFYPLFPFLILFAVRQPLRRLIWVLLSIWAVNQIARQLIKFTVSAGMPLIFVSLVLFGFYAPIRDAKWFWAFSAFVPLTLGSAVLGGMMFLGAKEGWIGSFPRTFLPISLFVTFGLLYLSRIVFQRWRPLWVT